MPIKPSQIYKHFYAIVVSSPSLNGPKSLAVYATPPTKAEIQDAICNNLIGQMPKTPHPYVEQPEVRIMPIHIPVDLLYK